MTDHARGSSNRKTLLPETEADQWADELDAWVERHKDDRDNPKFAEAEQLRVEIREIAKSLGDERGSDDQSGMSALLERLGGLRQRALSVFRS